MSITTTSGRVSLTLSTPSAPLVALHHLQLRVRVNKRPEALADEVLVVSDDDVDHRRLQRQHGVHPEAAARDRTCFEPAAKHGHALAHADQAVALLAERAGLAPSPAAAGDLHDQFARFVPQHRPHYRPRCVLQHIRQRFLLDAEHRPLESRREVDWRADRHHIHVDPALPDTRVERLQLAETGRRVQPIHFAFRPTHDTEH
jgi:hypothetical protein